MKFISWNVNGIRAIEKKNALAWVDTQDMDFLGLQEIKAEPHQIPATLFSKEFASLHVNASSKKGQSGVALYAKLQADKIGVAREVDILEEGRINEFHFGDIAFFNVYFPNGQSSPERLVYKMEFYDRFLSYCENLRQEGKSIVICGDVNTAHKEIDLARPKANEKISGFLPMERAWIDKFLAHGYVDTFRHVHGDMPERYSWWSYRANARTNNVGWRIDYFYVSEDLCDKIISAQIHHEITGSDHCPVSLELML